MVWWNINLKKNQFDEIDKNDITSESIINQQKNDKARKKHWDKIEKQESSRIKSIKNEILNLLKKHSTKMPASDIDAHLKHQNVDEIKKLCEEMYHGGKISRTANYRYFILSDEKKKPPKKRQQQETLNPEKLQRLKQIR